MRDPFSLTPVFEGVFFLFCAFLIVCLLIHLAGRLQDAAHRKKLRRLQELNEKEIADAYKEYQNSLERLRNDPNNAELRQQVLSLGRVYSNLTRNSEGVTVYDELALKNDIDAACAGAVSVQNKSIEDRLKTLQQLLSNGHITQEEYQQRKEKILDDV